MSLSQNSIIGRFVKDLQIPGCVVQLSSYDTYFGELTVENFEEKLEKHAGEHLFYLPGVRKGIKQRAKDDDIAKRSNFTIDIDVRSIWSEEKKGPCTDSSIFSEANKIINSIEGTVFESWRYINFSGNGLHIHYFGDPVDILDKRYYRFGLQELFKSFNGIIEHLGWECDLKCSNAGRIMRMLGSKNHKSDPPKLVENIYEKEDVKFDLSEIQNQGEMFVKMKEESNKAIALDGAKSRELFGETTFDQINNIPIREVVCAATGWEFIEPKHFKAPDWPTKGAMFVHSTENCLVTGGTRWLPNDHDGYSCYQFIKTYLQLNDSDTVSWFTSSYEAIEVAHSDFKKRTAIEGAQERKNEKQAVQNDENEFMNEEVGVETDKSIKTPSVTQADDLWDSSPRKVKSKPPVIKTWDVLLQQLADVRMEVLKTDEFLDDWKILMRGFVTRVSGYSNMGKSTVAYYLLHRLLENGYSGLAFSTEVVSPIVLASLDRISTGSSTYDICENKKYDGEKIKEKYKNLMIYDSVDTGNHFKGYEYLVRAHRNLGQDIDFIMVDYVQGVRIDDTNAKTLYDRMTKYAFDIQQLAQELNVCVMDVSQVNNESLNATAGQKQADFVGLKGSGDLFSAAEVVIQVNRNKAEESKDRPRNESADMVPRASDAVHVDLHIRKHKFSQTGLEYLNIDYSTGVIEQGSKPIDKNINKSVI